MLIDSASTVNRHSTAPHTDIDAVNLARGMPLQKRELHRDIVAAHFIQAKKKRLPSDSRCEAI